MNWRQTWNLRNIQDWKKKRLSIQLSERQASLSNMGALGPSRHYRIEGCRFEGAPIIWGTLIWPPIMPRDTKLSESFFTVKFFHSLAKFDSHMIIQKSSACVFLVWTLLCIIYNNNNTIDTAIYLQYIYIYILCI